MSTDLFAHKAGSYEQDPLRVVNVDRIADAIVETVRLERSQRLMDFGSGTGLLLARIAPHVGAITAVDVSPAMNAELEAKRAQIACELELLAVDLETTRLPRRFDGIVSSMTMHHIRDVDAMFRTFHALLRAGGFVAIADLEEEDGSFHGEEPGVFHLGFSHAAIAAAAERAGFGAVQVRTVSAVSKPGRDYPVLLLTARAGGGVEDAAEALRILPDDLSGAAIRALLEEHLADMRRISPPESVHALDVEGLRRACVGFWTVCDAAGGLLGCGALREVDSGHGEIKSMRTATAHRGRGVAAAMLSHLIAEARRRGYARLSLETGSQPEFEPARRLYRRFGFTVCEPFDAYVNDPNSVFMTRAL